MSPAALLSHAPLSRPSEPRPLGWRGPGVCVTVLLLATLWACDKSSTGLVGTDDKEAIALVADGAFEPWPEVPISTAAECYFDSTAWSSLFAEDGYTYVNLEGYGIDGEPTEAIIQFRIFRGTATFTLNAMALDGTAQPDSAVLSIVADMVACP